MCGDDNGLPRSVIALFNNRANGSPFRLMCDYDLRVVNREARVSRILISMKGIGGLPSIWVWSPFLVPLKLAFSFW
ncbi:hypothetical protein CEXT_126331 [Caerostris extrusa]|uniref:Uncharacterized protein n=1 Tax=Caerostris extrusa TaxID=172846 RepID=A0AAV4XDZ5_CAEEX|nr:hypothetical protein CEXT_126331 [Caerostris extrusa]